MPRPRRCRSVLARRPRTGRGRCRLPRRTCSTRRTKLSAGSQIVSGKPTSAMASSGRPLSPASKDSETERVCARITSRPSSSSEHDEVTLLGPRRRPDPRASGQPHSREEIGDQRTAVDAKSFLRAGKRLQPSRISRRGHETNEIARERQPIATSSRSLPTIAPSNSCRAAASSSSCPAAG